MNMQRPGFLVSCDKKSLPPAREKEVACLRLQVSLLVFSDENNIHSKISCYVRRLFQDIVSVIVQFNLNKHIFLQILQNVYEP